MESDRCSSASCSGSASAVCHPSFMELSAHSDTPLRPPSCRHRVLSCRWSWLLRVSLSDDEVVREGEGKYAVGKREKRQETRRGQKKLRERGPKGGRARSENGGRREYVDKRNGRTRRSRVTRNSTQAKHGQTTTWRKLVATTHAALVLESSFSTRPTSCTRTPWTTDVRVG